MTPSICDRLAFPVKSLEKLLDDYQNGDVEAFEEFFRRTEKMITRFLVGILRSSADVEDAFQDTYFRIHKSIIKYDPNRDALNWVFAIARNIAIDIIRKRPKHDELNESVHVASIWSHDEELRRLVFEALGALTEDERNLIHSRFVEGQSYAKIAQDRNLSEDNSRQKISRIIKKLKSTAGF